MKSYYRSRSGAYRARPIYVQPRYIASPRPIVSYRARPQRSSSNFVMWLLVAGGLIVFLVYMGGALTHATSSINITGNASTSISSNTMVSDASTALKRIDQHDVGQYANPDDAETWISSACSAASMTEVINSYGHYYRIADILSKELAVGAISSQDGLLTGSGIDTTVAQFGFVTRTMSDPTTQKVIDEGNAGVPTIVSFPPQTWPGGHILVVRGGNASMVHLADSSSLDMQWMSRSKFEQYWRGFAKVVTPRLVSQATYSVMGKPTITPGFINAVLAAYGSPAAGKGQALYDGGVNVGIDPVYALAFFMHESTFGTAGMARITMALGNIRCVQDRPCVNTYGNPCQIGESCYAKYYSWEDGFQGWYALVKNLYVGQWGRTTVDAIIPKYAPAADNNDETAYINSLKTEVDTWHAGVTLVN